MAERETLANLENARGFSLTRAEKLLSRRHVVEQVFDLHGRAWWAASGRDALQHAALDDDLGPRERVFGASRYRHFRNRADRGQGLAAEPERRDLHEVLVRSDLARGVAFDAEPGVLGRHTDAVVTDVNLGPSTVFH